eukprot:TRINITY_DN15997_c0_g1_i2.p1 TRINITY_DN15997_c0_g1~~TRINITY_DN15997_c0_g1_i2.p1  ORF type:complete len:312 (+),score=63.57 TRINITY_DN15997_c0_g1_i2:70-1005(+)
MCIRDRSKHHRSSQPKKMKLEEPADNIIPFPGSFSDHFVAFLRDNAQFFAALNTSCAKAQGAKTGKEYYKRRLLTQWKDPRVGLLRAEWVSGKKCLDVGCNEGVFTILVADRLGPRMIVGCDVEFTLVEKAIGNLCRRTAKHSLLHPSVDKKKVGEINKLIEELPRSYQLSLMNEEKVNEKLKDIVMFKQENYIANPDAGEKYETIFCMSTSKWVHLSYGDIGVIALFYKIYNSLTDGGFFIFENESWNSYRKKRSMSATFKENYKNIKLRPNQFEKFLTVVLRFTLVEKLIPPLLETKKGYDRTILVFRK